MVSFPETYIYACNDQILRSLVTVITALYPLNEISARTEGEKTNRALVTHFHLHILPLLQ